MTIGFAASASRSKLYHIDVDFVESLSIIRTALRIGCALGATPEFWLNLKRMCDLDVAYVRKPMLATSNRWWRRGRDSDWVSGLGEEPFVGGTLPVIPSCNPPDW